MAVHQLEHTLTTAMLMCDKISVGRALQDDMAAWERLLAKQNTLQDSTLGSLISILDRHNISKRDVAYLKWIKRKRDHFVHRQFHDGSWPGDLHLDDCRYVTRRLVAVQIWLSRANRQIWKIFQRAGFVDIEDLGEDGQLIANKGIWEILAN